MFRVRSHHRVLVIVLAAALVALTAPAFGQPYFTDIVPSTVLNSFVAIPSDGHSPAGVFADLNDDGYPDLYLMGVPQALPVPSVANVVYENVAGAGGTRVFQELVGPNSGKLPILANGAVAADYDNDGDLDLYVVTFGDNVLLQNQWIESGQTQLSFVDVTASSDPTPANPDGDDQFGLAHCVETRRVQDEEPVLQTTADAATATTTVIVEVLDRTLTAAWADVDRDGDLDVYVGNHDGYWDELMVPPGPVAAEDGVAGERDCLYRNNGNGTFTDITPSAGPPPGVGGFQTASGGIKTSTQRYSSSNAVIFADFNDDRWPDLMVSNKVAGPTDRDLLYVNQGENGSGVWQGFVAVTYTLPTAFGNMSPGAMGVNVGDPDRDGDFDIYLTDVSANPASVPPHLVPMLFNDLWVNQFVETGGVLDFQHSTQLPAAWSWGTQLQDFDNDGDEDVHVAVSGTDFLYENQLGAWVDQAAAWGVAASTDVRGDMSADYNRDGWVDLFVVGHNSLGAYVDYVNNMTTPLVPSILWQNDLAGLHPDHHFLSVKLVGDPTAGTRHLSSRDAIGARLELIADVDGDLAEETQIRELRSGSSNSASTSSLEVEFGLGVADSGSLVIRWPSGRVTTTPVNADECIVITENPFSVKVMAIHGP